MAPPAGATYPSPVQVTLSRRYVPLLTSFISRTFSITRCSVHHPFAFTPGSEVCPVSVLCSTGQGAFSYTWQPSLSCVLLTPTRGQTSWLPQPFLLSVVVRPSPIVVTHGCHLLFLSDFSGLWTRSARWGEELLSYTELIRGAYNCTDFWQAFHIVDF